MAGELRLERFGKFELLELIAKGGMAEVFLGRPTDAALSKLVAIKRILPKFASDPSFMDMFRRESVIVMRLRHPGIITVHEMGAMQGRYYMSMEYFPGETLARMISRLRDRKGSLGLHAKIFVIQNVAEALKYIHCFTDYGDSTEIIHRDISPHNIMVGFDGTTRMIDFGIAKISTEGTHSSSLKGKIAYMSPEQVTGQQLTRQSDIFSLGVVLWELLTESRLFSGRTIEEVRKQVEACNIPPITQFAPEISAALNLICQRALSKDLAFRYASAGDLASDLGEILKLSVTENLRKDLARQMEDMFPEEKSKLRERLRTYEVTSADAPYLRDTQVNIPKPVNSFTGGQRRRQDRARKVRVALGVGAGVLLTAVASVLAYEWAVREPSRVMRLPTATTTATTTPTPTFAPAPLPPSASTLAPPAAPAHKNVATKQEQISVPAPSATPPIGPSASNAPPATIHAPTVPARAPVMATPQAPARVPPIAPVSRASKPAKKKIERRIASKAAPVAFAYVTVLADPKARILINGKYAGIEVVNEYKVPAGQNVTITVAPDAGQPQNTKQFMFKKNTSNVVELGSAP